MKVHFIDIMLFVLFCQLLSITPFFLFQKRLNSYSNQLLGVFLLAKAFCISNFLAFRLYEYTLDYFPHLFFFGSSFTLLWGPSLYFYTKSLTYNNFRFYKKDILHLLPFISHFIYLSYKFHLHSTETKRMLISSNSVLSPDLAMSVDIFLHSSILLYTIASLRLVFIYRSAIKDRLSSIEKVQLSWLVFVLLGFFSKWIFDVWFFIGYTFYQYYSELSLIFSRSVLFLFINMMMFKVLKQPQLVTGIENGLDRKRLSLSKAVTDQYIKKLSKFMEQNKPYLDPNITLYELSEKVNIPPRSLSEVINNNLGQNFYDYINSYRIKESQQILGDPTSPQRTVLEVLYEVGFNSKSVFNNAFKKNTGMTPSQFKQHNLQIQSS